MGERVIFHVDANSAFLSWTAAYRLKVLGETVDLRQIPSVVAGAKGAYRALGFERQAAFQSVATASFPHFALPSAHRSGEAPLQRTRLFQSLTMP